MSTDSYISCWVCLMVNLSQISKRDKEDDVDDNACCTQCYVHDG
jgi:hypothetical protein